MASLKMFVKILLVGGALGAAAALQKVAPCTTPARLHRRRTPARVLCADKDTTPPPPPSLTAVFGSLVQVASEAAEEAAVMAKAAQASANKAVDTYVNSGWQVKKRAGQILPEIRPNALDISDRSAAILTQAVDAPPLDANGASTPPAGLADASAAKLANAAEPGSLAHQSNTELQAEFSSFLAARQAESEAYRITPRGEIVFASEEALSSIVVAFTSDKLQSLAVAARALARYVNDLESELEAADEAVVELRLEQQATTRRQREAEARAQALEADTSALGARLAAAEARLASEESARAETEARAEAAADAMLKLRSELERTSESSDELASAVRSEESRVVELEERLMAAEQAAVASESLRDALAAAQARLADERAAAAASLEAERARSTALEKKAAEAEQRADSKAAELRDTLGQSEKTASQMSELLGEQERVVDFSAPSLEPPPATSDDARAAQKALLQQLLNSGASPAVEPAVAAAAEPAVAASAQQSNLQALSRMKKADLVGECTSRGIEPSGSVAELRARLRVERKRSALVDSLTERGWTERKARRALEEERWDLDRAIARLVG